MSILSIVLIVVAFCIAWWVINTYVPAPIKTPGIILLCVVAILWLLAMAGLGTHLRLG